MMERPTSLSLSFASWCREMIRYWDQNILGCKVNGGSYRGHLEEFYVDQKKKYRNALLRARAGFR